MCDVTLAGGQAEAEMKQGYNARKVISEVCASFVLQRTVSGR